MHVEPHAQDCQLYGWKHGHRGECAELQEKSQAVAEQAVAALVNASTYFETQGWKDPSIRDGILHMNELLPALDLEGTYLRAKVLGHM